MVTLCAAGLLVNTRGASAAPPVARHVTQVVAPGADAVVTLRGYDVDGEALAADVVSLPEAPGALSQLSKVFSKFGYDPKKGSAAKALSRVTGTLNRVYYSRPQYDAEKRSGKWGLFEYSVSDAGSTSKPAVVTLVPPSLKTVATHFDTGVEGWTVVRNGPSSSQPTFDASSFGAGLNRFVVATDQLISTKNKVEANSSRFAFEAPAEYHGNQNAAYDGSLTFTLAALAGDLTRGADVDRNFNLVELVCATCKTNAEVTLVFPLAATNVSFTGAATTFTIPLKETAGWLIDPENELLSWHAPTQCEMIQVLSGLSSLKILGDLTDWYESVALDDVYLKTPHDALSHVPVCAQGTPDASVCTCDH